MNSRDRRALIIGAIVVGGAWLASRGVPRLWADWRAGQEQVAGQRRLLADTRTALEDLPRMEDSTRVLTRRVAKLAPQILSGVSAAVAVSDLSGRMGTLIGLCHGRMLRFEPVPDSVAAGPLRQVTASVSLETDFRGLAELLERLSRSQMVTVVERLDVVPADPLAPATAPETLNVELRVSAWYLARESGS